MASEFAYCGNNPVTRCDPGGEFWTAIVAAVALMAVCAVTASRCGSATSEPNKTFVTTPAISSSYLNEDSVLQIKYYYKYDREYEGNEASYEAGIRDESNYYVESVEVVSRENAMSRYRSIFSKDLP